MGVYWCDGVCHGVVCPFGVIFVRRLVRGCGRTRIVLGLVYSVIVCILFFRYFNECLSVMKHSSLVDYAA